MSNIVVRPIEKIKKKCLCCGNEMELFIYEELCLQNGTWKSKLQAN